MLRDNEFVKVNYIIFLTAIVKLKPKKNRYTWSLDNAESSRELVFQLLPLRLGSFIPPHPQKKSVPFNIQQSFSEKLDYCDYNHNFASNFYFILPIYW